MISYVISCEKPSVSERPLQASVCLPPGKPLMAGCESAHVHQLAAASEYVCSVGKRLRDGMILAPAAAAKHSTDHDFVTCVASDRSVTLAPP